VCTSFTPTKNNDWVKLNLGVDLPTGYPDEAYPGYLAPLAVRSHTSGRVACGLASFGLVPHWAKDSKISRHTYNARVETVTVKPSYRDPWKHRQFGLVLVDRFFEPHYGQGKPVRWQIGLESEEPFGIACLWETAQLAKDQAPIVSFTMLTVNADQHSVMNQFHKPEDEKRTPVVIPKEHFIDWLSADHEQAMGMLSSNLTNRFIAKPSILTIS
jgi:putative SOS response-associated peptidase YedK